MRPATRPIPNATNVSLYLFSFHAFSRPYAPMGPPNPFLINHFRTLFHAMQGGAINLLLPRVTSHEALVAMLQICPFVFNNFHDALPATRFLSYFCIVAGGG